jgi:hypothetical protein
LDEEVSFLGFTLGIPNGLYQISWPKLLIASAPFQCKLRPSEVREIDIAPNIGLRFKVLHDPVALVRRQRL